MSNSKTSSEPSFEDNLAELESLVEQLESGDLELAESLEKFKRGITLSKECRAMLDEAQQTIDEVIAQHQDETPGDEPPETSD